MGENRRVLRETNILSLHVTTTATEGKKREIDTPLFFFRSQPVLAEENSRHYPRAVFTTEPWNKDHMYTSVSRATLSLDFYYRW